MIDAYQWGKVNRISPEAPVPVIELLKEEERLGGAANVALNLRSLGAKVSMASIIGNDHAGNTLRELLGQHQINHENVLSVDDRKTTIKTRVIGGSQHLLRIDHEDLNHINSNQETQLLESIKNYCESTPIDAVVFEDYDKGLFTPSLIKNLVAFFNDKDIKIAVDPKKNQFLDYQSIDLFKPNYKELIEGLKVDHIENDEALINLVKGFLTNQKHRNVLLTLSERGILSCTANEFFLIPAFKRDIADVSGAGDTVIAVATLGLASNLNHHEIALLSNLAGGIVCEKVGVVAIDPNTLEEEVEKVLSSTHEFSIV